MNEMDERLRFLIVILVLIMVVGISCNISLAQKGDLSDVHRGTLYVFGIVSLCLGLGLKA